MRSDTENFSVFNRSAQRQPLYLVQIAFDTAATDLHYFLTNSDTAYPWGATTYPGTVVSIDGYSQRLDPLNANSTIGAWKITLLDNAGELSTLLNTKLAAGYGLRGKRVRIYMGFPGLAWSDYSLIGTQVIKTMSETRGGYIIESADIQYTAANTIFASAKTQLTTTIKATDAMTGSGTVYVADTTGFQVKAHDASYTEDGTNGTSVLYFRLDKEWFRATGKTATTFTGVTRAVFGTAAADHIVDSDATKNKPTVEEGKYFVGPALKLAYAFLTGTLYNQGGATLNDSDHLAIDSSYIDTASFIAHPDLWDYTDPTVGLPMRFIGVAATDGKAFIEREILLACGCFLAVNPLGQLTLKRMSRVLSGSGFVATLDDSNIVEAGDLQHAFPELTNQMAIDWNYDLLQNKQTRRTAIIDSTSQSVHGAAPVKFVAFRGIYGNKYTDATIGGLFDSIIDRYANPPLRIQVKGFARLNNLEVGENVRLNLASVRDYTGEITSIDRTLEIQQMSVDWMTGAVTFDLFGSSAAGTPVTHTANTTDINDSWYSITGTSLATAIGGALSGNTIVSNCTLTGGAHTNAAIYYHTSDLTIAAGVTVTITDNVQLRVKGTFTRNGTINGTGQGNAGGAAATQGTADYFTSISGGGIAIRRDTTFVGATKLSLYSSPQVITVGRNNVPGLFLANASGTLVMQSVDLRGTSGGGGQNVYQQTYFNGELISTITVATGGAGGAGGAGLITVARGYAGSGAVILNGGNGVGGGSYDPFSSAPGKPRVYAGSGAGGMGGAWVAIVDGNTATVPDSSALQSVSGYSPIPVNSEPLPSGDIIGRKQADWNAVTYRSYFEALAPISLAAFRLLRAPENTDPKTDSGTYTSNATIASVVESTNTPQTPAENLSTLTVTVTPPSDGNYSHSEIYYRVNGSGKPFQYAGPAKNTWAIQTAMDGVTYEIQARPVSIHGVESTSGPTTTKTVTSAAGGVSLASGNYIAIAKTGYADTTAGVWIANDGGTPKLNIGNNTFWMKWTGTALELAGDVASSGRLRATSGSNYVEIDGTNGIRGYDNAIGDYTFKIPLDGSAPIFSNGTISSTTFNLYTSSVIRTSSTVGGGGASDYGVLMNSAGIKGFKAGDTTPTFFLDSSDGSATFGQESTEQYIKFDAADASVKLGAKTTMLGADAYNNDNSYWHWGAYGLAGFGSGVTANSGTITDVSGSLVLLATTSANSRARIMRTVSEAYFDYSWDVDARQKSIINLSTMATSTGLAYWGIGATNYTGGLLNSKQIIFFCSGDFNLYSRVADGTNYTDTDLSVTLSASTDYLCEIVYTAGSDAKFYVNGVLKATVSTYLPSGVSNKLIFNAYVYNTSATGTVTLTVKDVKHLAIQ